MKQKKIVLGLAQLDNTYSLNPNKNEINKVMKVCVKNNIKYFDYSVGYSERPPVFPGNSKILLKIPLNKALSISKIQDLIKNIRKKKVQIEAISLHNPNKKSLCIYKYKIDELINLKKKFKIKKFGISIYNFDELKDCIKKINKVDIVQLPINILDNRICDKKITTLKKKYNFEVHARSIFLKGLLLLNKNERPKYFNKWSKIFTKWDQISRIQKLKKCFYFVNSLNFVDKIIVGLENLRQFEALKKLINYDDMKNHKFNIINSKDKKLIDPRKWKIEN